MSYHLIWYKCPGCGTQWHEFHKVSWYRNVEEEQSTCSNCDCEELYPCDHEPADPSTIPDDELQRLG
jgi:hypothetical protein